MKQLALAVGFLLEIVAVGAISFAGFRLAVPLYWNYFLGIVVPLLVIFFWAVYMAPRSKRRLKQPYYITAKVIIFSIAILSLTLVGQQVGALLFAVVAIIDELLLRPYRSEL